MPSRKSEGDARGRDPQRSRAAILQAARDEFAARGLAGARMDRIAQSAGLNKRLIYYYFNSKDDLFQAVLEGTYADIRGAEQRLHLLQLDPPEAIRRLVEFTWKYHVAHPEFITLLASANLHGARHLKNLPHVRELNSPVIQMLDEILERGRKSGVFRDGIDPVQLYISIASVAHFYLSNRNTLSAIFGRDLMSPKARTERLRHVCDLILGYVLRV